MKVLSVIVPIYNVEKFLKKCLDSIINQTYKNLEIILVEDGSPDNCGKICDAYAKKDNRIKVIHKENGGLVSARNAGLEVASGDYVSFIDPDDWIEKEMYAEMLRIADEKDVDAVRCGYYKDDDNTSVEKDFLFKEDRIVDLMQDRNFILNSFMNGKLAPALWSMLIKKEFYDKFKNNHLEHFVGEDYIFVTELLCLMNSIYFLNKSYYHYYKNTSSFSFALERAEKNLNELIKLYDIVIKILMKYHYLTAEIVSKWKILSFETIYARCNEFVYRLKKIDILISIMNHPILFELIKDIDKRKLSLPKRVFINLLKCKRKWLAYYFCIVHTKFIERIKRKI